jgi:tol-pal system protein YbgF
VKLLVLNIKPSTAAAILAAAFSLPISAHAALFGDDEARKAILELRGRLNQIEQDLASKSSNNNALTLAEKNDRLIQELAQLRGQVEVLTHELSTTQQRQKDFYIDLDTRLRKLEPQQVSVGGKDFIVSPEEQKAYDSALALFKQGDYKGAATAFAAYASKYPDSGYVPSAQYWQGNAHYAQGNFKNAIAAQDVIVKKFPNDAQVPDALFNIASSYIELNDKANAKKTLQTITSKYADTPAAQKAKERLATLK